MKYIKLLKIMSRKKISFFFLLYKILNIVYTYNNESDDKMKKNGFTLVELLAVLVILALLITIAVPNVISISQKIKKNMFCQKVTYIEAAAKLYGQDNIDYLPKTITVGDLVNYGYYKKANDKCVVGTIEKPSNNPCVTDPRDNSMLDSKTITLSVVNKQVKAVYQVSDTAVCDK
jgi:prepilin-type N-terminal cleavage/methylation domain-containing protein